jgi:hypothetical protein
MGADTYVYFPCETPKAELERAARGIGGVPGMGALEELEKGECLK